MSSSKTISIARSLRLPSRQCAIFLFVSLLNPYFAQADDELYHLINERLSYMQGVATHKFLNDLPIRNKAREEVVITSATRSALSGNLTAATTSAFFQAQIDAAVDIQACWFSRWRDGGPPQQGEDLNRIIRPHLIRLGSAITEKLPDATHSLERFNTTITVDCLSEEAKTNIWRNLVAIERYPDRLSQILQSGVLRVGTTGDYAPFSHSDDGLNFQGVDIDLAHDLAASMDVTLQFVHTSWPSLMADLATGSYDIAMSGVSKSIERAKSAYFSDAYYIGGKTPITRCERTAEFQTLSQIDQPGTRLIVNPGGTNEHFVDHNINHAEKVLHQDNRTIFEALNDGVADLMITDQIEADLQSGLHSTLCRAMQHTLTYQEKAYLLPQDSPLKSFVNLWLNQRRHDGSIQAAFAEHLTTNH